MKTVDEVAEEIRTDLQKQAELDQIEAMQYTLADAIEEGSKYGEQSYDWGDGETMCALSAAFASTRARGYA